MIHASDIFVFCITIFIALTFTSAGLYLTDELAPANQLHQLYEGHQLTYHEEKYGFYPDGVDKYITGANYVMIYSLMSPIISLPVHTIISLIPDVSRLVPLMFWSFILISLVTTTGILFQEKLGDKIYYLYGIAGISIFINMLYYSPFRTDNLEVISVVTTNILLYGLFGVLVWKLVCYMFCGENKRIFMWIATMSCSSLLFWVSVLKDHVLIALLFMIIVYATIKFYDLNDTNYLLYMASGSGLIIWERPELSIVVIPIICILLIYKFGKLCIRPLYTYGIVTSIFLVPTLVNNSIVTGSIFKFPFQAVSQTVGGAHLSTSGNAIDVLTIELPAYFIRNFMTFSFDNIVGIMIYPFNGGVGVLPIIMIVIFAVLLLPYFIFIKKITLITPEKILFIFSFVVVLMYLFTSFLGFSLHAEKGILPDMRYFSLVYATLMIASLSVISRTYELNYANLIRKFVIWFGIILIGFTIILLVLSQNDIMTTENINLTANGIAILIFAIFIAVIIDTIRTKRVDGLETIIPLSISLPLTWQIYTSLFIVKLYGYPMYIPLMQLVKKFVFG